MMASKTHVEVTLTLGGRGEGDDDGLDRVTREVLSELRELELESGSLATAEALPPGAKSSEAVVAGCIALQLLPVVAPKLIDFLGRLVTRKRETIEARFKVGEREATIKYTPGVTSKEQVTEVLALLRESIEPERKLVIP